MALRSRKRQQITGVLLAIVVLATRIPFIDKMLFEFDSIDFAVALVRFDLSQVTPHMPGYIIHILFGRLIYALLNNPHRAFLAVSILLSIGSVLALWRAAYHLRGERVALITALLWISAPMFWFYGEVETVYPHEAFFASVILWLGISLYRNRESAWRAIGLFVALSLATGARQSSLLFFVPAVIYIMIVSKQSARVWMLAVASFTVVTTGWTLELFHEAGGFAAYLKFAQAEHIYRSQSCGDGEGRALSHCGWIQLLDCRSDCVGRFPQTMLGFYAHGALFTNVSIRSSCRTGAAALLRADLFHEGGLSA
jgi:hypothetical protein